MSTFLTSSPTTTRSAQQDIFKYGNILQTGANPSVSIRQILVPLSFLLFIYEATYDIRKQTYSMKSLLQSLKFIANQAEVLKLIEILNAPVINGYVASNKKPQNPREYPSSSMLQMTEDLLLQD